MAEAATLVSDFVSLSVLSEEAELTVSALLSVFSEAEVLLLLLVISLFSSSGFTTACTAGEGFKNLP